MRKLLTFNCAKIGCGSEKKLKNLRFYFFFLALHGFYIKPAAVRKRQFKKLSFFLIAFSLTLHGFSFCPALALHYFCFRENRLRLGKEIKKAYAFYFFSLALHYFCTVINVYFFKNIYCMQQIRVHSYESMGTFDGPGLRYVVFLQGCPFRCLYCANPDTIDARGEGRLTEPEYILEQAVSMRPFFGKRGGITFSGGEPTVQAEALVPLFRRLKEEGIHICVDSNGGIWNEHVERLLNLTDLVLLDVKEMDDARHMGITGRSNGQTLRTAQWLEERGHPFWLRYVLVPGVSDFEEDLRALGERFGKYRMVERVELLPYHRLGVHKYEALGWEYKLGDVKENTPEQLARAEEVLKRYFRQLVVT